MTITGAALMGHLRVALPMQAIDGTAAAINESEEWALSSQTSNGQLTGKIIVVCDDTAALDEFKRLAREAGHTVANAGPKNTVLITPAQS